jgi:hypothetical protein
MANSFDGPDGLPRFLSDYRRLLDTLAADFPQARVVLLTPIAHERLGPPWPDPAAHEANLERYAAAIGVLAGERGLPLLPAHTLRARPGTPPLTENGIHLSEAGYRRLAEWIEDQAFGRPGAWRSQPTDRVEALRQAILRKNEWFFHRSRPANMAYIFGFRRKEQGRNAVEIAQFDPAHCRRGGPDRPAAILPAPARHRRPAGSATLPPAPPRNATPRSRSPRVSRSPSGPRIPCSKSRSK